MPEPGRVTLFGALRAPPPGGIRTNARPQGRPAHPHGRHFVNGADLKNPMTAISIESPRPTTAPASPPLPFIHIPTPGDHYSPATGSAISTLIYQFAKAHASRAGHTDIVLARGTRPHYDVGRCIEVAPRTYPPRWQRAIDAGLARFGLPRSFGVARYRP